jgi:hypothetical protein
MQAQILAEVETVLRNHGIVTNPNDAQLPLEEAVRLRGMALRIIQGDVDDADLSALTPDMNAELATLIQDLIALRSSPSVRQLERLNPYYSAFEPRIIRDGHKSNNNGR